MMPAAQTAGEAEVSRSRRGSQRDPNMIKPKREESVLTGKLCGT